MSSISAYGATIEVTQAGVYITPSRLAQALEHIPHLVPIDRITGATELSPPTAYGLGAVELTGTTEVIRFAPGQAANMTMLIDAVTDAVQGNAPALVPGLHFVGVDVETANADWGSICQIGVVRVVDGMQVDSHEWLCRPPAGIDHFDEGNIRIHGITPDMVTDAPDFAAVFPEVVAYVADQVLVAHNAQFDLTAFSRACHATGTPVPHWKFACSLAASRAAKLGITSHRLPVVAQHLGVELDNHHDAVADARACAGIFVQLALQAHATGDIETVFTTLGFSLGDLNTERIYPVLSNPPTIAVAGGRGRADNAATPTPARPAPKSARWAKAATPTTIPDPNPDADPNHPLFGHVITLTGDFEPYDKGELWEKMAAVGATVAKNVTKKTTMLVMGPWDSVTSKQKRAEELISKGQNIEMWQSMRLFTALGLDPTADDAADDDEPPF